MAVRMSVSPGVSEATLGVGIIGVSPVRGWALPPTSQHCARCRITRSAHWARTARSPRGRRARAFGVDAVFSDHEKLVIQPDIDLVAVTVKVPHHRELVSAAIGAGKAVYCEWPLGRDVDDARAMAALAAEQRVRTVVGLQARQAPAIEFVKQLLGDGYVGDVLSTTMSGSRSQATPWACPMRTCSTGKWGQPAHDPGRPQPGHPQLRTGRVRRLVAVANPSQASDHHQRDRRADRENGRRPNRGDWHPHFGRNRERPHA